MEGHQRCEGFHAKHLGVCQCSCVLVDVGLNNGASLLQWPVKALASRLLHAKPAWSGLQKCLRSTPMNRTCYYGFEANPSFDRQLVALQSALRAKGTLVKLFTSTAFSTGDGMARLFVQPTAHDVDAAGSTLEGSKGLSYHDPDHPSQWQFKPRSPVRMHYNATPVPSVDAGRFLAALRAASSFVAIKIDVEGFEFSLLAHLLASARSVVCGLDLLAVEWHEWRVPNHKGHTAELMREMQPPLCNVTLFSWH